MDHPYSPYRNIIVRTPDNYSFWRSWHRGVVGCLNEIARVRVGYEILQAIAHAPFNQIIVPNPALPHHDGGETLWGYRPEYCNAFADPPPPIYRRGYSADIFDEGLEALGIIHTPGTGSDSEITFNPHAWDGSTRCTHGAVAGVGPHQILLHEMLHAYRFQHGFTNLESTGDGYDNMEEYFAIVVANIYISGADGASARLRADHHGFTALTAAQVASFRTTPPNPARLTQIQSDVPDLVSRLRALPVDVCAFNPFRPSVAVTPGSAVLEDDEFAGEPQG